MEAKEAAPANVGSEQICRAQDLICGKNALLLWCIPIIVLVLGLGWPQARAWLWIPAFLVMGVACLVNAAHCGRLHCFVTGPLYLLSAAYVALAAFGFLPMRPRIFLLTVLCITAIACLAERPLETYRRKT